MWAEACVVEEAHLDLRSPYVTTVRLGGWLACRDDLRRLVVLDDHALEQFLGRKPYGSRAVLPLPSRTTRPTLFFAPVFL